MNRWIALVFAAALAVSLLQPSTASVSAVGQAKPGRVAPSPNLCLAGTPSLGWCGDGGPATRAKPAEPVDIAAAPDGSLVVADRGNNVIRRISPTGTIETIAGTGMRGGPSKRVVASRARFRSPAAVAVDTDGSVLVADTDNRALRRVSTNGVVSVVARGLRGMTDVIVDGRSYLVSSGALHR